MNVNPSPENSLQRVIQGIFKNQTLVESSRIRVPVEVLLGLAENVMFINCSKLQPFHVSLFSQFLKCPAAITEIRTVIFCAEKFSPTQNDNPAQKSKLLLGLAAAKNVEKKHNKHHGSNVPLKPNRSFIMNELLAVLNQFVSISTNLHSVIFDSLYLLSDLNKTNTSTQVKVSHISDERNSKAHAVVRGVSGITKTSGNARCIDIEVKNDIRANLQEFGTVLMKSTTVKWLCFRDCPLGDDIFGLLVPYLIKADLQVMMFESCMLTDSSCKLISSIIKAHEARMEIKLWNKTLRASSQELSGKYVWNDKNRIHSTGLIALSLSGNLITGRGLESLQSCITDNHWFLGLKLSKNNISVKAIRNFINHLSSDCGLQVALFEHNPEYSFDTNRDIASRLDEITHSKNLQFTQARYLQSGGTERNRMKITATPMNRMGLNISSGGTNLFESFSSPMITSHGQYISSSKNCREKYQQNSTSPHEGMDYISCLNVTLPDGVNLLLQKWKNKLYNQNYSSDNNYSHDLSNRRNIPSQRSSTLKELSNSTHLQRLSTPKIVSGSQGTEQFIHQAKRHEQSNSVSSDQCNGAENILSNKKSLNKLDPAEFKTIDFDIRTTLTTETKDDTLTTDNETNKAVIANIHNRSSTPPVKLIITPLIQSHATLNHRKSPLPPPAPEHVDNSSAASASSSSTISSTSLPLRTDYITAENTVANAHLLVRSTTPNSSTHKSATRTNDRRNSHNQNSRIRHVDMSQDENYKLNSNPNMLMKSSQGTVHHTMSPAQQYFMSSPPYISSSSGNAHRSTPLSGTTINRDIEFNKVRHPTSYRLYNSNITPTSAPSPSSYSQLHSPPLYGINQFVPSRKNVLKRSGVNATDQQNNMKTQQQNSNHSYPSRPLAPFPHILTSFGHVVQTLGPTTDVTNSNTYAHRRAMKITKKSQKFKKRVHKQPAKKKKKNKDKTLTYALYSPNAYMTPNHPFYVVNNNQSSSNHKNSPDTQHISNPSMLTTNSALGVIAQLTDNLEATSLQLRKICLNVADTIKLNEHIQKDILMQQQQQQLRQFEIKSSPVSLSHKDFFYEDNEEKVYSVVKGMDEHHNHSNVSNIHQHEFNQQPVQPHQRPMSRKGTGYGRLSTRSQGSSNFAKDENENDLTNTLSDIADYTITDYFVDNNVSLQNLGETYENLTNLKLPSPTYEGHGSFDSHLTETYLQKDKSYSVKDESMTYFENKNKIIQSTSTYSDEPILISPYNQTHEISLKSRVTPAPLIIVPLVDDDDVDNDDDDEAKDDNEDEQNSEMLGPYQPSPRQHIIHKLQLSTATITSPIATTLFSSRSVSSCNAKSTHFTFVDTNIDKDQTTLLEPPSSTKTTSESNSSSVFLVANGSGSGSHQNIGNSDENQVVNKNDSKISLQEQSEVEKNEYDEDEYEDDISEEEQVDEEINSADDYDEDDDDDTVMREALANALRQKITGIISTADNQF